MQYMLTIVCALCVHFLLAQPPKFPFAGTYGQHFSQPFSYVRNTAALADVDHLSLGVFSARRFGMKELGEYALTLGVPVASGAMCINIWQQGFTLYREQVGGLAYALPLGARLKAGLQLNYRRLPYASQFTGEVGMIFRLTDHCRIGLQVFNPSGSGDPPAMYVAGIGYEASKQFLVEAEWQKEQRESLSVLVNAVYRPARVFWVNLGFGTKPVNRFLGMGCRVGELQINMMGSYHWPLGITPSIMLAWDGN